MSDEHVIVSGRATVSGAHRQFEAEDLRARACRLHHGRGEPWPPAPGDRKHAPWRFFGAVVPQGGASGGEVWDFSV